MPRSSLAIRLYCVLAELLVFNGLAVGIGLFAFKRGSVTAETLAWTLFAAGLAILAMGLAAVRHLVKGESDRHAAAAERLQRLAGFYLVLSRANQLISQEHDAKKLCQGICELCVDTTQASRVMITTREGGRLRPMSTAGGTEWFFGDVSSGLDLESPRGRATFSARAIFEGKPQIIADYPAEQADPHWRQRAIDQEVLSIAVMPLHCGDTVIGTLSVGARKLDFFDPPLVQLLEELALDISVALDNIKRENERRASTIRADRLSAFLAALSQTSRLLVREHDEDRLFEEVCQICVHTGGVQHVTISRLDDGEVQVVTHAGPEVGIWSQMPRQWRLDDPQSPPFLLTHALRSGQAIVSNNYGQDSQTSWLAKRAALMDVRSVAVFPLRRSGQVAGALQVFASEQGFFDADLVALLEELAGDLSLAMDKKARIEAEAANRAKTEFLARMSHELRTPLNAILGFSQLLIADAQERLNTQDRRQLDHIRRAGWHLLGLINDVLDVSRIESGRLRVDSQAVALAPLLEEAIRMAEPLAGPLAVRIVMNDSPAVQRHVLADAIRLRQVLINVLSNAVKYNRPGGSVRISVRHDSLTITVEVADTGIGMTREQLAHLYEPFNRLGRERGGVEGTGIGLALTRQLVRLMSGELAVDSDAGRGTTVRIALPASQMESEPALPLDEIGSSAAEGAAGVVLYIEDNSVNLLLVEQLLSRWSEVRLVQAEDGASGLELARTLQPDLILLDLQLPDVSGLDLLRRLRSEPVTRDLKVVALSADALPEDVAAAHAAGAAAYWTKPLDFESFLRGVQGVLASARRRDDARASTG